MNRKRKIVFVDPPLTLRERYGYLAGAGNQLPSAGLLSLAAVARKNGFETAIVDGSAPYLDFPKIVKQIFNHHPDYVGITAISVSIYNAAKLAGLIKEKSKDIITIIGGPHISAIPTETMERFPAFDISVVGEGEDTIIELLQALTDKADLKKVPGLVIRDNGQIHTIEGRQLIKDLDRLPLPAWDILDNFPDRYHPSSFQFRRLPAMSIITSRGCPNKCIFCDRSVFGNHCRAFSAEYVIEMIKVLYHKYGIRELIFEDEHCVLFKQRLVKICEMMLEESLDISWSCMAIINKVEPALLKLMKKAGCWQIGYGIESGDKDVLEFTGKGITLREVEQALEWTKAAGIESRGFFILGSPIDTDQTIQSTIDFVKRLSLDDIDVCMMTPFPGTKMYEIANRRGKFDNDWRKMTLEHVVFISNGLTKERLEKYFNQMLKEFYLRPRIIMRYIFKIIRYPKGTGRILAGLLAFLKKVLLYGSDKAMGTPGRL